MNRIKFNQLNANRYGVITNDGRECEVLCWDLKSEMHPYQSIMARVKCFNGNEVIRYFYPDGTNGGCLSLELKKPPFWRAYLGNMYYTVEYKEGEFDVVAVFESYSDIDDRNYRNHVYFYSPEEANEYVIKMNHFHQSYFQDMLDKKLIG